MISMGVEEFSLEDWSTAVVLNILSSFWVQQMNLIGNAWPSDFLKRIRFSRLIEQCLIDNVDYRHPLNQTKMEILPRLQGPFLFGFNSRYNWYNSLVAKLLKFNVSTGNIPVKFWIEPNRLNRFNGFQKESKKFLKKSSFWNRLDLCYRCTLLNFAFNSDFAVKTGSKYWTPKTGLSCCGGSRLVTNW